MKTEQKLKIFLIAGEPSGDVLGGKLIAAIKEQIPNQEIELIGIGGTKMRQEGVDSIFPIQELSLMGFAEVVPHIPKLLRRIKQTANRVIEEEPDIVITIDAPDFCFRVMKKVNANQKSQKIKKVHFIAPSVWAYRPGRAKEIAKLYDLLLAILPFEPPYFEKYNLKTIFIGHPITEKENITVENDFNFREKYNIKQDDTLLCLTPGSRTGEIKRILSEMIGAVNILVKKYPNLTVAIPTISKTHDLIKDSINQFKTRTILIKEEEKHNLFQTANLAIAKSGTNTLELAMFKLPMIIVYKANFLTYLLIKLMVKIKFANLINLICNREIIPELLQFKCNAVTIAQKLEELLNNPNLQKQQISESISTLQMLGMGSQEKPSQKAAKAVLENL